LGGRLPSEREELERLPGVGQYVAGAVLAICHGKREPLLDVNMARLLERYFGRRKMADIRYDPYLQALSRLVLPNRGVKEFNWAMLDFASMICTARNPDHQYCPLRIHCKHCKGNQQRRA
jgi:A/G-specific adenine glycosylase